MSPEMRWLAACGLLLGAGLGLMWAGGVLGRALAEDDRMDVFTDDGSTAYGPPVILPDPTAYDAPEWMT